MTKSAEEGLVDAARLAGEVTKAVVEAEVQMLHLVQAEMDALGNLILTPPKPGQTEAEKREAEAEVEASFDNMPV
jgi:hypothetical protein